MQFRSGVFYPSEYWLLLEVRHKMCFLFKISIDSSMACSGNHTLLSLIPAFFLSKHIPPNDDCSVFSLVAYWVSCTHSEISPTV